MAARDLEFWMWSDAFRAERLQRQFFRLQHSRQALAWEPPADVIETESELLVFVALPGVDPERVQAVIEDGELLIAGTRVLPAELSDAVIHRLELPQGHFVRRISLPSGRYDAVRRASVDGCLLIGLRKADVG